MFQNPGENPRFQAMKARGDENTYVRMWKVPLTKALPERPGYCCYATWCGWCASYQLRKQALYGDMTRYTCCNGAFPCSGRCGEQKCPECCLCLEVSVCFASSVATTRFMVQDELRIHTSKCDNCIIGTMIALEYIACICHLVACITGSDEIRMAAQIVQCIADIVWCSVCGCMQTQHKEELDDRDKNGALPQAMMAPGAQVIPVHPGGYPHPGPGGYPQPGPGGYPQPGGYPPPGPGGYPQPGGYPPPAPGGYPPPGYGGPAPGYGAPAGYPQQQGAPSYGPPPGYPQQPAPLPGRPPMQPSMQK